MEINNFDTIRQLLDFHSPNSFYFVQIIKRRKENPDMKNTSKVLDVFYVYSIAELEAIMPYIQAKCFGNNARAYINLNELDSERAALGLLKKCADLILQKEFRAVKNVYATVCGNLGTIHAKR